MNVDKKQNKNKTKTKQPWTSTLKRKDEFYYNDIIKLP